MNYETEIKKKFRGFTLIELLVVISITGIVGSVSIISFSNYNRSQILQTAANELATTLNLAKSRAQSQLKPCSDTDVLKGYKVSINTSGADDNKYKMDAICWDGVLPDPGTCGGSIVHNSVPLKPLPPDITFTSSTFANYCFPTLIGGVQQAGEIILSGYGQTKRVIIDSVGGIRVQ